MSKIYRDNHIPKQQESTETINPMKKIPNSDENKDASNFPPSILGEYKVTSYSKKCEEYSQIESIIPLKKSTCKFIIYIILNIITVMIINLFISWFPKLNLYLYYSVVDLKEATHVAVNGKEGGLVIKPLKKTGLQLLDLNDDSVISKFRLNVKKDPLNIMTWFEFRSFDYIFDHESQSFIALDYQIKMTQSDLQEKLTIGLNKEEVDYMRSIFGICDIDIKVDSIGTILLNELTDPFYLFQLYSVILWYCTEYYYYASVIVILTIVSSILSVYETYTNLKQLSQMSRYSCPVNVFRKNENNEFLPPININSTELVPGDLYEIPEDNSCIPCDTILVSGSVIINESMLTGESTPIIKIRLPSTESMFDTKNQDCEKYMLFGGTKIVQKRLKGAKRVLGVVYQTGFQTVKGNLIRTILFPKQEDAQFTRDSVKYIVFMSILCVVGFLISLKFLIVDAELLPLDIVERFLDLITTTVPPSLPACISVGITYSLNRLKKKKIFCIKREALNSSGSVNVCVFDKTGTLTEDTLSISGYVPAYIDKNMNFSFDAYCQSSHKYSDISIGHFKAKKSNKDYHDINKDLVQAYTECLACCHCITYVKNKLVGDPIDVKMFEGLDWIYEENSTGENTSNNVLAKVRPKNDNENLQSDSNYELEIVRRFDFSSKLQRMTTIAKNVKEDYYKIFCKGSPEKLKELTKQETWPMNYDEMLNKFTTKGYRVLAMAYKSVKMDIKESQIIQRDFCESDMIFLGFLIVKNKLKDATASTITKLDNADLKMVMATGDNIFTAICISRECNLVSKNQEIFTCEIQKDQNGNEKLIWHKLDSNENDNEEEEIDNEKNSPINSPKNVIETENVILKSNKSPKDIINVSSCSDKSLNDLYPPIQSELKLGNEENDDQRKNNSKNLIKRKTHIFDQDVGEDNLNEELSFIEVDTNISKLSVKPLNESMIDIGEDDSPEKIASNDNFVIAISGQVFERLSFLNQKFISNKPTNHKSNLKNIHNAFRLVLKNGVVFARMAPEHKAVLVRAFKEEGYTTLMCGDGANDCSALRTAHVGVSLSPEEASIAASFTSQTNDISCLIDLIKEGKCSLITSLETFKYMILYSFIQFFTVTLMLIYLTYLSDFQFLVSDLFIIFPLSWFLSRTHPADELTYKYPQASLLSFPTITSIAIQAIISFVFQFGGYKYILSKFGWENICDFDDNDNPLTCHENTILFLISHYQYLGTALAFSSSKPFRQRIYTNWLLIVYLIIIYFYSIWFTINCDDWSRNLLIIFDFEGEETEYERREDKAGKIKYYIFVICVINFVLTLLFEWVVMYFVKNCYELYCDKKCEQEVLRSKANLIRNEEAINVNDNNNLNELPLSKHQRVYFFRRRQNKEHKN